MMCIYLWRVCYLWTEQQNLHSCEEEQYTVKKLIKWYWVVIIVWETTIFTSGSNMICSTFHVAAANVLLSSLHTCCSLVLLQRAPVSQWSKQTAEHSHFTLLNLSHMAFTPVAALSKNPGQTNTLQPETVQICSLIHLTAQSKDKTGL